MATQMSAVTIVGTTGQAYLTGLRFIQFYFGLPLAMIILSLTVVPFFTRARVYTAYEYLERRFDVRVRSLASFLFLMGRAASLGVTLAAPSVVMSAILGWTLPVTVLAICVPMIVYTTIGGVQAVAWTDVKQMFVVVGGMSAAVAILIYGILQHVSFGQALHLAGATGRLNAIDFRFNLTRDLHVLVGHARRAVPDAVVFRLRPEPGAALPDGEVDRRGAALAADERLRQDPAAAADPDERRAGVRVLPVPDAADALQPRLRRAGGGEPAGGGVRGAAAGLRRARSRARRDGGHARRPRRRFSPATRASRTSARRPRRVVKQATGDERYNDVNYVFPTFITTQHADRAGRPDDRRDLRGGDVGERRRAERAGDGDDHRLLPPPLRHGRRPTAHYLLVSKLATIFWGLFACVVAMFAANQGSLIEVVNRYGSFFYGSLLGVFILAILTRRATARGAFWGMIAGHGRRAHRGASSCRGSRSSGTT